MISFSNYDDFRAPITRTWHIRSLGPKTSAEEQQDHSDELNSYTQRRLARHNVALHIRIDWFAVLDMDGGNYGFSGEAAVALRHGPCTLDRPPAFFANTVEYHRRESLHHKVGLARVQGRGNRSSA
jgi:hypothetical protein